MPQAFVAEVARLWTVNAIFRNQPQFIQQSTPHLSLAAIFFALFVLFRGLQRVVPAWGSGSHLVSLRVVRIFVAEVRFAGDWPL